MRLLPDGRPTRDHRRDGRREHRGRDVLELIAEFWRELGIKLFSSRRSARCSATASSPARPMMSIWPGLRERHPDRRMPPTSSRRRASSSCSGRSGASTIETERQAARRRDMPEAKRAARALRALDGDRRPSAAAARRSGTRCSHPRRTSVRSASSPARCSRSSCATRCTTCRTKASTAGTRGAFSASTAIDRCFWIKAVLKERSPMIGYPGAPLPDA